MNQALQSASAKQEWGEFYRLRAEPAGAGFFGLDVRHQELAAINARANSCRRPT